MAATSSLSPSTPTTTAATFTSLGSGLSSVVDDGLLCSICAEAREGEVVC